MLAVLASSYDFSISALREKCSDTEFFPVFSTNVGKYGPEKTLYLETFHAVFLFSSRFVLSRKVVVFN